MRLSAGLCPDPLGELIVLLQTFGLTESNKQRWPIFSLVHDRLLTT